jgi:Tfp pilus assembly protein PilW
MIAMALGSLVATMGFATTRTILEGLRRFDTDTSTEQNATAALDLILRDIQMAGCAAGLSGETAVQLALPASIRIITDLNADGDSLDANERLA